MFVEYIFSCVSKAHNDEQNKSKAHIIETEIIKWLELLVSAVDMFAEDAVDFLKLLYDELSPKELGAKYRNTVAVSVSDLILTIYTCIWNMFDAVSDTILWYGICERLQFCVAILLSL